MGQLQHTSPTPRAASAVRRLRPRVCLRKGCESTFQPRCWNQRYCQAAECLRLVRRWQAAKRQRQHRQEAEHRQRHREAERERRKRRRERRFAEADSEHRDQPQMPDKVGAWSRSKNNSATFCDRPGCYDPVRASCRAPARYCGDACRQAVRRVLDRERKWLTRRTYAGQIKRRLEYQRSRKRAATLSHPPTGY